MFTAADVAAETGQKTPQVLKNLNALAAEGVLRCESQGYDPTTGRRVTLFWRSEDEPAPMT